MSFKAAVEATPHLGPSAFMKGLQALNAADRARIACDPSTLCGSVNLDEKLQPTQPTASRWDYAVCWPKDAQCVHWIEVHPASDHGITDLLAKVAWLQQWLDGDGLRFKPLTKAYVWISSGRTTFTKGSSGARKLAAKGVIAVGGHYKLR